MRRSFKGDDLYKSIFYEYVRQLNKEKQIMEFFIEGTRSRSNKILPPKFGFMSICTKTFFDKEVDDITLVPVTLNYTRTLENDSFMGELRGEQKVPESLSRVLKAVEVLRMNLGTMYVDFCQPISVSQYTAEMQKEKPEFDPFRKQQDRVALNFRLAHDIVFRLQKEIRMMPTNMVASIVLLYRQGISKLELRQKVDWLGSILTERGAKFANDSGLPSRQMTDIGLEHLKTYLVEKQGVLSPKIVDGDYGNYIMLYYFRNPLNQVFFNEAIILAALHSFGLEQEWQTGVGKDDLFERSVYLSQLLKREEFVQHRITADNREFFDLILAFMIQSRYLMLKQEDSTKVLLRTSGESQIIFIRSLIFPMIDSYYVTLVYILTFVKNKGIDTVKFAKNMQWLSELLHKQGSIQFFESCNQQSINNAMFTYIDFGILQKQGMQLELQEQYQNDESHLLDTLEKINRYRSKTQIGDILMLNDPKKGLFRRSMISQFPFMAKL